MLLGDAVKLALRQAGITEERFSAWLGKPCGCGERVRKLNQLHRWVAGVLAGGRPKPPAGLDPGGRGDFV